jgi:hypothetical protein
MSIDHYDVQAMIRDERHGIRTEIIAEVEELRAELRAVADELRETIAGVERTVASRTERLA